MSLSGCALEGKKEKRQEEAGSAGKGRPGTTCPNDSVLGYPSEAQCVLHTCGLPRYVLRTSVLYRTPYTLLPGAPVLYGHIPLE